MKLLDFFKKKSPQKESSSPSELLYFSVRNAYQFAVEVSEDNGDILFIHLFNGIRTDKFGKTSDYFNGFSHYGASMGAGNKQVFKLTLVHLKSQTRILLDKSLVQNSGLPTTSFQNTLNELYVKFGEIDTPAQPQCYDLKNGEWLIFESREERNKRRMKSYDEKFRYPSKEDEITSKKYFLDEFNNWFIEDKQYEEEQEKKWFGIENGVFVDYYNSNREIKRGEISNAYGMRDYDLISIEDELEEIPLKNIIKIIE